MNRSARELGASPIDQSFETNRRKLVWVALGCALAAASIGAVNTPNYPTATGFNIAVSVAMAAGIAGGMLWLWRRPQALNGVVTAVLLLLALGFVLMLGDALFGRYSGLPLAQIQPPFLPWLPLLYVASFVLLPLRRALFVSLLFYLAGNAVILSYAAPRLWSGAGEQGELVGLTVQFVLGHAIYILLLSMVPWLQRRYRLAREEIESLRRHEEALNRLDAIFTASPDALLAIDYEGLITDWNPAAEALFGYRADEVIGKSTDILRPDEDQDDGLEMKRQLRRGKSLRRHEVRRLAKDGSELEVNLTAVPFQDAETNLIGAAVFYRDIAEERATQRQLENSEQRFRGAFDNAPIGMSLVAPDGRWVDVNQALCDILGYTRGELLATDFQSLTHADDLALSTDMVAKTLAGELSGYRIEKRYIHKDGHVVWALLAVSLVRDHAGKPQYLIGQIEDITNSKHTLAELERSNAELAQFAHVVAHDLREPLRGISGFAGLLDRHARSVLDPRAREFLDMILQSVNRADRVTTDLLDYSLAGASTETSRVDVNDLVGQVIANLGVRTLYPEATIEYADLPKVQAYPGDIQRLFQNLIGNALKFSRPGVAAAIRITGRSENGRVAFSVSDNGIGIPAKHRHAVFRIFHRLHGREVEGTGVGLAICKKVAERYGGYIAVSPAPEQGAEFHFTLPAAPAEARRRASSH